MITFSQGDIFDADVEALINPVNCVGVMGKGLAEKFKERFPIVFAAYQRGCKAHEITPGKLQVVRTELCQNPRVVINFPTKDHWRNKSRLEYIQAGLMALPPVVTSHELRSIAIPALGCGLGGLAWSDVHPLIEKTFASLPTVSVLLFEPR